MPTVEKVIMVDRLPEKLTGEDMKKIKEDYASYCVETYQIADNVKIPNRDAKNAIFAAMLSPLQYFIEDKVRIKRLNEGRLDQEVPFNKYKR
jgi:hypothetical protein